MRRTAAALGLLLAGATVACLDDSITGTRPTSFSLTASVTAAAVGDSITFDFDATGTSIFGVLITYGDGAQDTLVARGPNTVVWAESFRHAYQTAGTYNVVGRMESAGGSRADTVQVLITGGS